MCTRSAVGGAGDTVVETGIGPPARPPAGAPGVRLEATVAHELKNALTAMKALVQLGLRSDAEQASHARLTLLERELTRMQEALTGPLSPARRTGALSRTRVELGPLVSGTLQLLAGQASDARVRLVARGDATVEGDARRLEEAVVNLVSNAIQATPPGGEVAVEVRPSAEEAEIVVRDTGQGMRPETLRRLGTPYFTTRASGTGLGVVLARSAIELHGGTLRYESEPGRGTTARATLPAPVRAA